jgi:hypothetical protein
MTRNSKDWFVERIGERIYRDSNGCDCSVCKSIEIHGLVIHDELHAQYLYDCQNEIGINYYETKKEKRENGK